MPVYEFYVTDADGFWGSVRAKGPTEREARAAAHRWLNANERWPNGSLVGRVRLRVRLATA